MNDLNEGKSLSPLRSMVQVVPVGDQFKAKLATHQAFYPVQNRSGRSLTVDDLISHLLAAAGTDSFVDALNKEVGLPQEGETEDEFVSRGIVAMRSVFNQALAVDRLK